MKVLVKASNKPNSAGPCSANCGNFGSCGKLGNCFKPFG